jgi:uncharacterized protein involved in exopolysaccharide biosynthesis
MNDDSDSYFDIRAFIRAAWKRTAIGGVIGLVTGIIFAFASPKWYTAELSLIPSAASKGGPGAMISGAAAALGVSELPFDLGGGGADVERIDALIHSNSVKDSVISKFNLLARYKLKYLEDAREALWKHCATKLDKKASLITLACEDKVPATASAMVAYIADEANRVAHRTSTSTASEERRFLDTRVAQAKTDLDQASRKLRDFQEQNKVISLPEQAKAIVASVASLRAQLLDKQLQLAFVDGFAASDESTSVQLRRQVGILDYKIKSLQEAKFGGASSKDRASNAKPASTEEPKSAGLFPPAMNIPKLQYELEELLREQKIQETLLAMLTQRYEMARISEARDTSTFQILDQPVIPTKKSKPKRMVTIAIACFLGCVMGIVLSMISRSLGATGRVDAKQA